jgi:hypothetical protein
MKDTQSSRLNKPQQKQHTQESDQLPEDAPAEAVFEDDDQNSQDTRKDAKENSGVPGEKDKRPGTQITLTKF